MTAENRPYDWASETPARQKANRHAELTSILAAASDANIQHHQDASRHTETPSILAAASDANIHHHQKANRHAESLSSFKCNGCEVFSLIDATVKVIIILATTATLILLGPAALNFLDCLACQVFSVEEEQKETQKYIDINIDINIDVGGKYRKTTGKEFQENSSVTNLSGTRAYQTVPDLMTYSFCADKAAAEGSKAPEGCLDDTLSKVPDAPLLDSELSVLARYGSKSPHARASPPASDTPRR